MTCIGRGANRLVKNRPSLQPIATWAIGVLGWLSFVIASPIPSVALAGMVWGTAQSSNETASKPDDKADKAELPSRQLIGKAKAKISDASKRYKAKKMEQAAELLNEANRLLQEGLAGADSKVRKAGEPVYQQLADAYKVLAGQGQALDPLPLFESMLQKKGAAEAVSFRKQIAPWLVQQCGRCHINDSKGGFSLASYEALMKGTPAGVVLFAGEAKSSRIVEVIETGDMPRGSGKVSSENLELLKKWIDQGAIWDGEDVESSISDLVKAEIESEDAITSTKPSGKETVSFSRDIAPVLIQQCNGCHFQAPQVRGGLRLDNITQLLRGGDSGKIVVPKAPESSLLIKKLRGSAGQRMPAGRPPLSDDVIAKFAKWIEEGASFDGTSANDLLSEVANQAWAKTASQSDLAARRQELALAQWKKVNASQTPVQASDEDFLVVGNIGQAGVDELLAEAHAAMKIVRRQLKLPEDASITKGPIAIFAFAERYDYGEFGKMVENRTLPPEWPGHWRKQTLQTYVALAYESRAPERNRLILVQQIASIVIGSYEGVPQWLADGVGRKVLANVGSKDDARVKQWQSQLGIVGQQLQEPQQLLDGKLGEEQSALAGFAVANAMMEKSNRKNFDKFMTSLRKGEPFDKAFTAHFGPLPQFLKNLLGLR